ncbi:MAG: hypothetical protein GVY16_03760 [Planctomycetes bacterium]|jgi:hypothetical protein|nr:hypothetical protein [Phycisphaerae bacterium]NBB94836.1 hypothetical protein [Planctomycetota bacterium]
MKIFLAGIMQGSKIQEAVHAQDWREPIRVSLEEHLSEAEIYCHYTAHPNSLAYTGERIRATFEDGVTRARNADILIAYLPSASMGTAIEMYEAWQSGALVLTISPMAANWVIRLYSHEIFADVDNFVAYIADGRLQKVLKDRRLP